MAVSKANNKEELNLAPAADAALQIFKMPIKTEPVEVENSGGNPTNEEDELNFGLKPFVGNVRFLKVETPPSRFSAAAPQEIKKEPADEILKAGSSELTGAIASEPELKPFVGKPKFLKLNPVPFKFEDSKTHLCDVKKQPGELVAAAELHTNPNEDEQKPVLKRFAGNPKYLRVQKIQLLPKKAHNKKFTCDICCKGVGTKGGLMYHIKAHLFGRPFKCNICHRDYATKNDFDTHNKRHQGNSVFCDTCKKSFSVKSYLADHIVTDHFPKTFACHQCKETQYFSCARFLSSHTKNKHDIRVCKLCQKALGSYSSYVTHCKDRELMLHKCKNCSLAFPCRRLLLRHQKEERLAKLKTLTFCELCKKNVQNIKKHNYFFHNYKKCLFCPFATSNCNAFDVHLKTCIANASKEAIAALGFHCKICDSYFVTKLRLSTHRNSNHGNHMCPQCPKRFIEKRFLKSHIADSHATKPYKCILCPMHKNFSNLKLFNSHFNNSHNGSRRNSKFTCDKCGRRSKFKEAIAQHVIHCNGLF